MSIADHFYHKPEADFVRTYDTQTARSQFQVSLVLILILILAAFVLDFLVHSDAVTNEPVKSSPARAPQVHVASDLFGQVSFDARL
jgi:hypothetical protein